MPRRVMCIAVTVAALSLAVLSSACSQEQISEQLALVRSAEQGDAAAQASLGFMYRNGEGVPQDYGEALRWYRLAADQGHASAQVSLGSILITAFLSARIGLEDARRARPRAWHPSWPSAGGKSRLGAAQRLDWVIFTKPCDMRGFSTGKQEEFTLKSIG